MYLQIHDNMTVEAVSDRFSECFPNLKVEFFDAGNGNAGNEEPGLVYSSTSKISAIRKIHRAGVLEIKSWYTVAKVQKLLRDQFGLYVQILRRAPGGKWIESAGREQLVDEELAELC